MKEKAKMRREVDNRTGALKISFFCVSGKLGVSHVRTSTIFAHNILYSLFIF